MQRRGQLRQSSASRTWRPCCGALAAGGPRRVSAIASVSCLPTTDPPHSKRSSRLNLQTLENSPAQAARERQAEVNARDATVEQLEAMLTRIERSFERHQQLAAAQGLAGVNTPKTTGKAIDSRPQQGELALSAPTSAISSSSPRSEKQEGREMGLRLPQQILCGRNASRKTDWFCHCHAFIHDYSN